MAIDRLSVTRTDFPPSRRGYDRIAVDRHLDEVAREIETLQQQRPPSVGASASAQVQSILDAAEASANEIERRAWEDASRVQEAADEALSRARAQVSALGAASHALRQRVESLLAEVEVLEGTLGEMAEPAAEPQDTMAFDPVLEEEEILAEPVAEQPVMEQPVAEQPVAPEPVAPLDPREVRFGRDAHERNGRPAWFAHGAPARHGAATQTAGLQEARESARLVALNMADGGQPREAADRYLSHLFEHAERQVLLDEIYGA